METVVEGPWERDRSRETVAERGWQRERERVAERRWQRDRGRDRDNQAELWRP